MRSDQVGAIGLPARAALSATDWSASCWVADIATLGLCCWATGTQTALGTVVRAYVAGDVHPAGNSSNEVTDGS